MEQKVRLLRADEIECRIGAINENGLSLLLYIDSRVAMNLMDEAFGLLWKRKHIIKNGNVFCRISVFDEKTEKWISREDVGVSGFSEKEKSAVSDSFKRSAVSFGCAKELYTSPFIWLSKDLCSIQKKDDRYYTRDRFSVSEISYGEDRRIIGLTIVNDKGKEVFRYSDKKKSEKSPRLTSEQIEKLDMELERTGVTMDEVSARYEINGGKSDISPETYKRIMAALKKTKSAA